MKPIYFEDQDKTYNQDGDLMIGASERNYLDRINKKTCTLCGGTGIVYGEDELVGYGRDAVIEPVEYACPKCSEKHLAELHAGDKE